MKKRCFYLFITIISVISLYAQDIVYKELSVQRYTLLADDYPANEKICFTGVTLWSDFHWNSVTVTGKGLVQFKASMSNDALNWLLDYSEKDYYWFHNKVNIYGITLAEKEGDSVNKKFRIEKIELQ